jgi:hypothetical protein
MARWISQYTGDIQSQHDYSDDEYFVETGCNVINGGQKISNIDKSKRIWLEWFGMQYTCASPKSAAKIPMFLVQRAGRRDNAQILD